MQKEVLEALAFNMTLKAKVEDILQNLQESVATTEKGQLDMANPQFFKIFERYINIKKEQ